MFGALSFANFFFWIVLPLVFLLWVHRLVRSLHFFSLFVPLTGFFRVFHLILPFLFTSCCCDNPRSVPQPLVRFRRSDPLVVFFFFSGVFLAPGKLRLPSRSSLAFFLVVCLFLFFFFSPLLLSFASS